jgi:muramidase (phage lysozyme)
VAGKSAGFAIGIGIQDGASAGLDAINKRIAALNAPAERFNKSLAKFGEVTGINRAAEGMATLGDRVLGAARAAERLAGPMAGITGAASLAGVMELSRKWADAGNSISKTADALNMPVHTLSRLQKANLLAGGSTEALNKSMGGLTDTIHAAFYNHDANAQMYMNSVFGPNEAWRDKEGHIAKAEDLLGRLADKAATYADRSTAGRALSVVGVDTDLLPLLEKGQKGLDEFLQRADRTGAALTDGMAADGVKMKSAWVEMGLAIEGVENRMVDHWSGTATKMLNITSQWIEKHNALLEGLATVTFTAAAGWVVKKALRYVPALLRLPLEAAFGEEALYYGTRITGLNEGADAELDRLRRERGMPTGPQGQVIGNSPGEGPPASDRQSPPGGTLTPLKQALLDTIAAPESHGLYNVKNGGALFAGYGSFPDYVGRGGTSTASGKYQFTSDTWKEAAAALGLTDFSPASQDKAAWWLANRTYTQNAHRNLGADLLEGGHEAGIAGALRGRWPSLPGGSQAQETQGQFNQLLAGNLGRVQVDVHLHGAPAGTTATATASGAAVATAPRVDTGMAFAGR